MKHDVNGLIQFVKSNELKNVTKKAKKIERPELQLTLEESKQRASNIIKFLKLVHPGNVGNGFMKAIEIKFLLRGEGASHSFYKPTLLFGLDSEKTEDVLADAIHETSSFSHCCYYSLYTFDNKKEVRVQVTDNNGRKTYEHKPVKKIVEGNTYETWVLPIDIDGISREEYEEYRGYLLNLGIETIGEKTGNGYQLLVLLDKPLKIKKLYQEFTSKLRKLIPAVDASIDVPTQVFRLPYTRNCKEYSNQFLYYKPYDPQAKEVVILDWTEERYPKKVIFDILDKEIAKKLGADVPTRSKTDDSEDVEGRTPKYTVEVLSSRKMAISGDKTYQDLYKHVDFGQLPLNIQNILKGTTEGFRNKCVLYLTPFFNKVLGLTQEQALATLETFNNLCTPAKPFSVVKSDYYRFSEEYGDYKKGSYEPEMIQEFGKEEMDTLIRSDFDKILFDNEVIKKFNVIHHSAIQIYLAMKLLEIESDLEKKSFTKEEIAVAARVSPKTVQRYIRELTKYSIVVNVKGNNKQGIKKGYKINEYGQYINGFTKLNKSLVKTMLMELTPSEMVVYTYMMCKVGATDSTLVFTSQKQIALAHDLTQQAISLITESLKEKKYIRKKTFMGKQHRKKTTYTLRNE